LLCILFLSSFSASGGSACFLRRKEISIILNKIMPNKAKFRDAKNARNSSPSNNYQQQTTNNQLPKTNPNKANFIRLCGG
jgi:hypothetical protein